MDSFGNSFRVSIFGESHGKQIGVVLDGVPAGLQLSEEDLMGDIDDLLHQNYKVEIPSFRMQFFAEEGKAHIQSAQMTDWISIPEMRDMFLRQKSDF